MRESGERDKLNRQIYIYIEVCVVRQQSFI